ncbi:MAG: hypothetical protein H9W81_13670 [Enterococcus sp.]|nr:hypothetical protein [Enterococcus sp.]
MNFLVISIIVLFTALLVGLALSAVFHRIEDNQLEFDGGYDDLILE